MLVFVDESGDPGLKVLGGSSRLFTISLVVFEENDEALACDQRIELLKRELGWTQNPIVVIDRSGNLEFRNQLAKYLRNKINLTDRVIKNVKMQRSEGNNLLQLADYTAGVINRSILNTRKKSDAYRKMIAHREIFVQVWPKLETPTLSPRGTQR